jgi:Bacterial Ig-like domain/Bacterial Ig domain
VPRSRQQVFGPNARTLGTLVAVCAVLAATILGPLPRLVQASGDVGYQDGSYSGSAPTGREPQSKLWFNDGSWWASMYGSSTHRVDIHRLDWASQTWIDTGVQIDERSTSLADALWDGTKLYVVSAVSNQSYSCTPPTSGDLTMRVLRYSYNASAKSYSIDAGFPVTITTAAVQAVSLAEDSTGMIWVTWGYPSSSHGNVYMTHSTSDTAHYASPFVLPLSGVTTMECSDYSAIVAYSGNIGVMWSNQVESDMYFGIHVDGQPDTSWTRSTALSGTGWADNHVNVKSLVADPAGQVFAASKTSLNGDQCPPSSQNDSQPLVVLTWMDGTGGWQHRTVSTAHYCWSRPLVQIDPVDRQVYVFATQPAPNSSYGSGGSIMYKQTSLDNPNFDSGAGTPFISLAADPRINNVSGTKQTVSGATGLVVLAADDSTHRYVHNAISIGGPDTTPPTVTATVPTDGASNVSTSTAVSATFSEGMATSTINASTFTLIDATTSTAVPASVSYNSNTWVATLTPTAALAPNHTFAARVVGGANGVTDLAGNPMTNDATWGFTTSPPSGPLFTDGFESGNFSAWTLVKTSGDGTASVQSGVVKSGTYAAQFTESTGASSYAYARKTLAQDQNEVTVSADVQLATTGSSGKLPLLRLFDAGLTRRFSLDRANSNGALSFTDGGGTVTLSSSLALATWGHIDVHIVSGTGTATVEVKLDGTLVYSSTNRTLTAVRTLQIGNDTKKQLLTAFVDNVAVSGPGGGPAAPDTTITSGPSGTVNATSASFAFTSTVGGSSFSCTLDGGAATACTSPTTYNGLAEGTHTFTVAATANGLTDPTPASRTWTIDLTAPTISSTTPANGSTDVAPGTTVSATFNEAMAAGSITTSTFTLTDTTTSSSVAASVAYNSTTQAATLTPSAPLANLHTFLARVKGGAGGVTDTAGNPLAADVTWSFTTSAPIVDTTPPTVAVTAPPAGSTVSGTAVTISANATDNVAVDHVDFLVNGVSVGSDSSSPYSTIWDSTTVQNGPATITAHAVDTAGNSADSSVNVTVQNGGGGPLFSDDFESGTFAAWTLVKTAVDGTATVQSSVVKSGTFAARLNASSTSGSLAYVRKTLSADQTQLTITEDVQVFAEGLSTQNIPFIRIFDASGARLVGVFRQSQSGNKVYAAYGGVNHLTTGLVPLNTWVNLSVKIVSGSGNATVEVRINGTLIWQDTTATIPAMRTLQIGNDTAAQPLGLYIDNFSATTP